MTTVRWQGKQLVRSTGLQRDGVHGYHSREHSNGTGRPVPGTAAKSYTLVLKLEAENKN